MFGYESSTERFKKIIIIFWTIWWIIALWTDIVGVLAHNGLIQQSWAPDSNYPFLVESLKMYYVPDWFPPICMAAIIVWSFLSTLAFCWVCTSLNQPDKYWMQRADFAFILSITFWLALFLADQLVMKYDLEENHMVQGGFQLLSYLTLYIIPEKKWPL